MFFQSGRSIIIPTNANITKIDPQGASAYPPSTEGGGPVVVTLVGDEIRVRSMTGAMSELQAEVMPDDPPIRCAQQSPHNSRSDATLPS